MHIEQLAAAAGIAYVEHHECIGSTNDRALELAADPHLATPALVLADRQSAGRGRGSNRWWSAPGGLTFSVVLESHLAELPVARWPQISLAVAVAIGETLASFTPPAAGRFGLKWPNDVHVVPGNNGEGLGRKISGVLVEIPKAPLSSARRMVVGIGVNVNNSWDAAPPEFSAYGVALCDLVGQAVDQIDVLKILLERLFLRLDQLTAQPAAVAQAWSERCLLRGRRVTAAFPKSEVSGTCLGIEPDGSLVLQTAGEVKRLYGGTIRKVE